MRKKCSTNLYFVEEHRNLQSQGRRLLDATGKIKNVDGSRQRKIE
jgi:hypothetical protein